MRITPYPTMLLHSIHPGTSLCQLFFPGTPKTEHSQPNTKHKTYKTGFQTISYKQTQSESDQRTSAQLIFSAHKKHPLHKMYAGGI